MNRLKHELQDLSAGAFKLEEASCAVAAASLPTRTRGIFSAAAAAGEVSTTAATKLGVAVEERRAKSAAVGNISSSSRPAAAGADRASLSSLVVTQRAPPPRSDSHPRAGRSLRGSLVGQSSPMEWNRDWGGEGTEASRAPVTIPPDGTTMTTREVVEQEHAGRAIAVQSSDKGGGEIAGAAEVEQTAVSGKPMETEVAAPAAEGKTRRPCPLAGILDMSEPPLRGHRRSYYNEDDGRVYRLSHCDTRTAAGFEEPPREEERMKCVIDFKGEVQHGEDCVLRGVAHKTLPPNKRNSLALEPRGSEQEPPPLAQASLTGAISVRTWHKDSASGWDPAGVGEAGGRVTGRIEY